MKKSIVMCVGIAALMALNFPVTAQDTRTLGNLSFKNVSVIGTVVDEAGKPVPNIRLELELAPEIELKRGLNIPTENELLDVIERLKQSVGSGIFVTVYSGEKGEYRINGVPIPGIYYLFVRNAENYVPARIKLYLNASEQKEFNAQKLTLRAREGGIGAAISEKAMKEVEKARKAAQANDTKKAVKHMLKALEIEPEYAEGHYNLAVMYMSLKKKDDAVKHLEKAAEIQEDYKPALKTLGELYLFNKNYEKAADYFSRFLAVRQKEGNLTLDDAKIYFMTGNSYQAAKQKDKALPYYQNYLAVKVKLGALDPKDSLICADLGSYYYQKKEMDNAVIFYTRAIEANPDIGADTYMYLGNCYLTKRDGLNAIKCYEKYLELDPKGKFAPQVKGMVEKLKPMYSGEEKKK